MINRPILIRARHLLAVREILAFTRETELNAHSPM